MTILENCKVIKPDRDYKNQHIHFKDCSLDDPWDYPYVREGKGMCKNKNWIPIKRKDWKLFYVFYDKGDFEDYYDVTYYYLKDYDLGMSNQKKISKTIIGYFWWGNKEGKPRENKNPTIIPSDAVRFLKPDHKQ